MDKKIANLFGHWEEYVKKAKVFFDRLNALFSDLSIAAGDIKIFTFVSSAVRGEIRSCGSGGESSCSPRFIKAVEEGSAEKELAAVLKIKKEQSSFLFSSYSDNRKSYDEFGPLSGAAEEAALYGAAVQYRRPTSSNKLLAGLLEQIGLCAKAFMDDDNHRFEEYMPDNLVYIALKKQMDIDLFNTLAASAYEKKVASGGIVLIGGNQSCRLKLCFEEAFPLEINNVRQIRKLLEMTGGGLYLIAKNNEIIGLGNYVKNSEMFVFTGHQRWSYYNKEKELFAYKEGKYIFILDDERTYISGFPKNFIGKGKVKYLNSLLNEIKRQKHGTLLIISDDAKREVGRLCKLKRGYAIKPLDLKQPDIKSLLPGISRIDGAIFIDTDFVCHGIGIILDGIAVKTGLNSRGARYNSAKCYIDNKRGNKYVAIVASDDETIDIIF